jgi:hypothetical protein
MAKTEYEQIKNGRIEQEKKDRKVDHWKSVPSDQRWLPSTNPKPIDDEPWLAG